jgi:membrane protein required for colicin V production
MLDSAVVAVIVLFAVLGALTGLLLQVLRLVAAAAAAVAALELAEPALAAFPGLLAAYPAVRPIAFQVGIFTIAYVALSILARVVRGLIHGGDGGLSMADRLTGAIAGAAKGAVVAWFIVSVLIAAEERIGRPVPRLETEGSTAAEVVKRIPFGVSAGDDQPAP